MIVSARDILRAVGEDEAPRPRGRPRIYDPVCTTPGCTRPHRAYGLCTTCRLRREKSPGGNLYRPPAENLHDVASSC